MLVVKMLRFGERIMWDVLVVLLNLLILLIVMVSLLWEIKLLVV